jgi:hypothetical protein
LSDSSSKAHRLKCPDPIAAFPGIDMLSAFRTSTPPPETSRALQAALRSRGFATEDFRVEEESDPELSHALGVVGGILKVRCRSTGEERLYSTGAGSGWLGAFLMDLGRGHFADALRSVGPATLAPARPVATNLHA